MLTSSFLSDVQLKIGAEGMQRLSNFLHCLLTANPKTAQNLCNQLPATEQSDEIPMMSPIVRKKLRSDKPLPHLASCLSTFFRDTFVPENHRDSFQVTECFMNVLREGLDVTFIVDPVPDEYVLQSVIVCGETFSGKQLYDASLAKSLSVFFAPQFTCTFQRKDGHGHGFGRISSVVSSKSKIAYKASLFAKAGSKSDSASLLRLYFPV